MDTNRIMKVFVSSTFVGLETERDYLMTKVFPQLKRKALQRNVAVIPLDLRWGVTREQAEQGKIVGVCLDGINNSRPYFIGILGKRYGWIPPLSILTQDSMLESRYPQIRSDIESKRSMTEIEIRHAVLRNKENDMDAFFYVTDSLEVEENQKKLIKEISDDGRFAPRYYHDEKELGRLIVEDFSRLLEERYPLVDNNEHELLSNYNRAELLQLTQIYIDRPDITSKIDFLIENEKCNQILLYGLKGSGKSSIIADWVSSKAKNAIYLFVGGVMDKSRSFIQRFVLTEINKILSEPIDIPNGDESLNNSFVLAFDMLSEYDQSFFIVLDGLNQVQESNEGSHSMLSWLPLPPANVKYIVSTNSEEQRDLLCQRGFSVIGIPALDSSEREESVIRNLKFLSKTLSPKQISQLVSDKKSSDASIMMLALNEMVTNCVFETVDDYIKQYIDAINNKTYYYSIISRACAFLPDNTVKDIFGLVSLSQYGLKPIEIQSILHLSESDWEQFYCAYAFLFIEYNELVTIKDDEIREVIEEELLDDKERKRLVSEAVCYFERELSKRKLLDNRPLSKEEIESLLKIMLRCGSTTEEDIHYYAGFMTSNYLFEGKKRALEELAFLYWSNNHVESLYEHLMYPVCVVYLYETHLESLKKYWRYISDQDSEKSIRDYFLLENENNYTEFFKSDYYFTIAKFVESDPEVGVLDVVIFLMQKSILYLEQVIVPGMESLLIPRYNEIASLYNEKNDVANAEKYYSKAREIVSKGDTDYLRKSKIQLAINEAQNQYDQMRYDEAVSTCQSVLKSLDKEGFSSTEKKSMQAVIYNILGNALADKASKISNGILKKESIEYSKKSLDLYKELLSVDPKRFSLNYAKTLSNLALSYQELGQDVEAIKIYTESCSAFEECDLEDLHTCSYFARILTDFGALLTDFAEKCGKTEFFDLAADCLQRAQVLYQKNFDRDPSTYSIDFGDALYNFGRLARRMKKLDKSIQAFKNALELYGQNKERKAQCLAALGQAFKDNGEKGEMNEAFSSAYRLFLELNEESPCDYYQNKLKQIKQQLINS